MSPPSTQLPRCDILEPFFLVFHPITPHVQLAPKSWGYTLPMHPESISFFPLTARADLYF